MESVRLKIKEPPAENSGPYYVFTSPQDCFADGTAPAGSLPASLDGNKKVWSHRTILFHLEPVAGIEPATASLRMKCSAIETHRHICFLTKNIILHRSHDFQYYLQTFYCIQFSQKLAGLSMFDMVTYSMYVCF